MKGRASLLIIIFLFLAGCARTQVTRVWVNGDYKGQPLESLVILAQVGNAYDRSAWENIISDRYRGSRMDAVAAGRIFPESSGSRLDLVIAHARGQGIQGVLMIRHVDTRSLKTYHPPEIDYYYSPRYYYPYRRGYYRGYRQYHPPYVYKKYPSHYYPPPYFYYEEEVVVTPGYTTYHTVVLVESYLYLSSTGEQIWSMSTETLDPRSPNHLAADISRSTFRVLRKYGLIRLSR